MTISSGLFAEQQKAGHEISRENTPDERNLKQHRHDITVYLKCPTSVCTKSYENR